MAKQTLINGTTENWENGKLGMTEEYAEPAGIDVEHALDEALELKAISIRMPMSLISSLKMIAGHHGIGYQPLMRDVLTRFARAEIRDILVSIENQRTLESALSDEDSPVIKHIRKFA
jgi:predicted DNA binding CopG/RHH family protein